MNTVKGWHFVGDNLRGGGAVPANGVWLSVKGRIRLCAWGLHGSEQPWDALRYSQSTTLCRVTFAGRVQYGDDKLVARQRRIDARADVAELLLHFVRMKTLQLLQIHGEGGRVRIPNYVFDAVMLPGSYRGIDHARARIARSRLPYDSAAVIGRLLSRLAACVNKNGNATRNATWVAAAMGSELSMAAYGSSNFGAHPARRDAANLLRYETGKEFNKMVYDLFGEQA